MKVLGRRNVTVLSSESSTLHRVPSIWFLFGTFLSLLKCVSVVTQSTDIPSSSFISTAPTQPPVVPCINGQLTNGTCVCNTGWTGTDCSACGGRVLLTDSQGSLLTGASGLSYVGDKKCSWLIKSESNDPIILTLVNLTLECAFDYIHVYDGDSMWSYKLASFSGVVHNQSALPDPIVAWSGTAYVVFISDAYIDFSNVRIDYQVNKSAVSAARSFGSVTTSMDSARFVPLDQSWPLPSGRSGAQLVAVDSGNATVSLVLTGGYQPPQNLANMYDWMPQDPTAGGSLLVDVALQRSPSGDWSQLVSSTALPSILFGHSATYSASCDCIYVFGGFVDEQLTLNMQLFTYSFASQSWQSDVAVLSGGQPVAYHTAHMASVGGNESLYVLFGYSPSYGYSSRLQTYYPSTQRWVFVKLLDDPLHPVLKSGLAMHASAYDQYTQRFYVFGGVVSEHQGDVTDKLFSMLLHPDGSVRITRLRSAPVPVFQSSAVLSGSLLLFFFGQLSGDPTPSGFGSCSQRMCLLDAVLAYDTLCDEWLTLDCASLGVPSPRFASAVTHGPGTQVHLFGGSNFGVLLNDAYRFQFGDCNQYQNYTSCYLAHFRTAQRCVWLSATNTCVSESVTPVNETLACSAYATTSSPAPTTISPTSAPSEAYTNEACLNNSCSQCLLQSACGWYTVYSPCDTSICLVASICLSLSAKSDNLPSNALPSNVSKSGLVLQRELTCPSICSSYQSCSDCKSISDLCVWCESTQTCLSSSAYRMANAYGDCPLIAFYENQCASLSCIAQSSCSACQSLPHCGWCSDTANGGLGVCLPGGYSYPFAQMVSSVIPSLTPPQSLLALSCLANNSASSTPTPTTVAAGTTAAAAPAAAAAAYFQTVGIGTWDFTSCPLCQCNGHSLCYTNTSICINCTHNTTGNQCQTCQPGFYGNALDGGSCSQCSCSHLADSDVCNSTTGQCACTTKGVIGTRCDRCDFGNNFIGQINFANQSGSCYYYLVPGYEYKLTILRTGDTPVRYMNFASSPPSYYDALNFRVNANSMFALTITYACRSNPEKVVVQLDTPVMSYDDRFDSSNYVFSQSNNCTFYVYMSNFTVPLLITIAFSQQSSTNSLLLFFVLFTGSFVIVMLCAMIFWRVKQRWNAHVRRREAKKERTYMARRPYGRLSVIFPAVLHDASDTTSVDYDVPSLGGSRQSSIRRSDFKLMLESPFCPLGVTPLNERARMLNVHTALIVLPGDASTMPSGTSMLALGNALTSIDAKRHPEATAQWNRKVDELLAEKKKSMHEEQNANANASASASTQQTEPSSVNTASTQNISLGTADESEDAVAQDTVVDSAHAEGIQDAELTAHVNMTFDVTDEPDLSDYRFSVNPLYGASSNSQLPAQSSAANADIDSHLSDSISQPRPFTDFSDCIDRCDSSQLAAVSGPNTPVHQTFL